MNLKLRNSFKENLLINEKAISVLSNFYDSDYSLIEDKKQAAKLMCVDFIINEILTTLCEADREYWLAIIDTINKIEFKNNRVGWKCLNAHIPGYNDEEFQELKT